MRPGRASLISLATILAIVGVIPPVLARPPGGVGAAPATFSFGLIGNQRYTAEERARFPELIQAVNAEGLAFSVYNGDLGAQPADCRGQLGGLLIVEVVPADQPGCRKGEPIEHDKGTCTGAHLRPPTPGSHVRVTGPWAYDRNHGHMEIHPVWGIDRL